MLTGSTAMNFYAQPRMTRDIDLVVALEPADAERAVKLFETDYYISDEAVTQAIKRESVFNAVHLQSMIKVDVIVRKNSPFRKMEFERRVNFRVRNRDIWIASKEDLIISKLFWAKDTFSEIQIRDIKNLVSTGCDEMYIENWSAQLNLSELWKKCHQ